MFAYVCIILTHLRDRQKSATTQRSLGETGEVNGSSQICRIPAAARRCHVPSNYGQKSKQAHPQRKVELTRIEALAGANLRSNLTIFDYICLRSSLSVTFLIRVHWDSTLAGPPWPAVAPLSHRWKAVSHPGFQNRPIGPKFLCLNLVQDWHRLT